MATWARMRDHRSVPGYYLTLSPLLASHILINIKRLPSDPALVQCGPSWTSDSSLGRVPAVEFVHDVILSPVIVVDMVLFRMGSVRLKKTTILESV